MLTLRASLVNVREDKIDSMYFFCAYEALHNDNNHLNICTSLQKVSFFFFLNKVVWIFEKEKEREKNHQQLAKHIAEPLDQIVQR